MNEILPSFIAYLAVCFGIAWYAQRRTRSTHDYYIGGRSLSKTTTALSAGASDMSGWLLLGLPGAVYATGLVEGWIVIGLVVGAWLNWSFVAKRLRVSTVSYEKEAITLPRFFYIRTGEDNKVLLLVTSLVILIFFAVYVASGFVASAKLFGSVLDIDYHVALAIGVAIVIAYTVLGGFLAVSWTDTFQALLMLAALIIVPALAIALSASVETTESTWEWNLGAYNWLAVIGLLAWGLGYFGQPHILARFMAIKDPLEIPVARNIGMSWMIVASIGALCVGAVGVSSVPNLADPERIFIELTSMMLNPWIAGVIIAAILAAIMSTVDSQLIVTSTILINDALGLESAHLNLSRVFVVGVALVAAIVALDDQSLVFDIVASAWAGLGSTIGPCVLFSLYWRGTTAWGLIAGLITGTAVTFVWDNLSGGIFEIYELLPAFLCASMMIFIVSKLVPDNNASTHYDLFAEKV